MTNLKEQYKGKTINEIEGEIHKNNGLSLEARKRSILALLHLKTSSRYKENPLYRKSNFENYLMGVFNIRLNTFMDSARAFDKHPKESVKYGVGLVSRIFRSCGAIKEKKVLKEINTADKASKIPLKRDKIEKIIQKYSKPLPPKKEGYKSKYFSELKNHQITKDLYNETIHELKKARDQIEKLKITVMEFKERIEERLEVV